MLEEDPDREATMIITDVVLEGKGTEEETVGMTEEIGVINILLHHHQHIAERVTNRLDFQDLDLLHLHPILGKEKVIETEAEIQEKEVEVEIG